MRYRLPLALIACVMVLNACRKKDDPITTTPASKGVLKMEFSNVVGSRAMNLNTSWYTNAAGDSFQISTYNYYISNIVLSTQDGKTFTEPESYHLIEQSNPATWSFKINDVPAGDYTSVQFMIGVDSLHNSSGAQSGDLSPSRGMIWSWNTGYIMAKMEGRSPKSPNAGNNFYFHIAGYKDGVSVLKTVKLAFPTSATVTVGGPVRGVHFFSDAAQWFTSPQQIDLATMNNVQVTGRDAQVISDNYADMFTIDHID